MARLGSQRNRTLIGALICTLLVLPGCGGTDIELNGAIFDVMGISGTSKAKEPKMRNRAGLIVPPSTQRLPPPGSDPSATAQRDPSWPTDPEERKLAEAAQQRKAHEEYCKKATLRAKVEADRSGSTDVVMGPLGRCDGSILDIFKGNANTQ